MNVYFLEPETAIKPGAMPRGYVGGATPSSKVTNRHFTRQNGKKYSLLGKLGGRHNLRNQ